MVPTEDYKSENEKQGVKLGRSVFISVAPQVTLDIRHTLHLPEAHVHI